MVSATLTPQIDDLIEQAKAGSVRAQYEIYDRYVKAMYNTALRLVGDVVEAEDVIQEAFLKAFMRLDTFNQDSTFGAWLKRIVVNQSFDQIKKRKPVDLIEGVELKEDQELTTAKDEQAIKWQVEKVRSAMIKLPDGYRQILSLYLIEGYDHNEISEITGVTVSTSKSQFHRAKKKLLNILNSEL